jgi:hypothetical protein
VIANNATGKSSAVVKGGCTTRRTAAARPAAQSSLRPHADMLHVSCSNKVGDGLICDGPLSSSARRYQAVGSVLADPSGVGCPPSGCPWYSRDWERTGTGYRTKDEKDARSWTIHSWRS